jgi:hypothetical protein
MKKTLRSNKAGEMKPEYRFDYSKARPNRFAERSKKDAHNVIAVLLEPDVARVFDSSESVNKLLRSVISAVPEKKRVATRKPRRRAS